MRMMRLALLLLAISGSIAAVRAENDPRPNILLAIADDWGWPHAPSYGDKIVKTPNFERLAADGILFTHAFCASPSCTPSRGSLLTGQAVHRLEEGGNLWSRLPKKFETYPDLLEAAGYVVGVQGKGWGPGELGERTRNPAGKGFKSFEAFLAQVPDGKPFCFWFGSKDPHRAYVKDSGVNSGMNPADVTVPAFLPDCPEVRKDILDYYFAVQRFDRDLGEVLQRLEKSGRAKNTIVVVTGDNGMPFPRCKANVYDMGARQPFAVRWPEKIKAGRKCDAMITLTDLAPTFLEAAGLKATAAMTGRSLMDIFTNENAAARDKMFLERERHANVRAGDLSYPCRAIRTREFLYIRNMRSDRWPAGEPEMWKAVGPFGDVDGSPSKDYILGNRNDPAVEKFFQLSFGKRPAEELYDVRNDPYQLENLAERPALAESKKDLRAELDRWMKETNDPRAENDDNRWDKYPYVGK